MYCKECGFNMGEGHIACPKCGTLVDFETNDKYGIDWNLNGKSKPMPEIEPIKVEPPKVEKPNEELPTIEKQKTEDSEGLKVEPIQWETRRDQSARPHMNMTRPIQPKTTAVDKAAMVKLVFGLGCLVVGIISILVNHTRNSIVEDDYDYEDENRPEDLLPSNIFDPTRLFTFRGVVFNDCGDYEDVGYGSLDVNIATELNDARDNCMLLSYGTYSEGDFETAFYCVDKDIDIYDIADGVTEARYADDSYIYYYTMDNELYRYDYNGDDEELIDSDLYSWSLSNDDNYLATFKIDGTEDVICTKNQAGEVKELYRTKGYYELLSISNDGDFAYLLSLENDYEVYSLENGKLVDLGFHCTDSDKFHTSFDGRSMICADGDKIYYHQAGEETAQVIGEGDQFNFVLKSNDEELSCSFLTEDFHLHQLTIKDGEITTTLIGNGEYIKDYAVAPDNTFYYLNSATELYRWKDGESTFLATGVDYSFAYDATNDAIVYQDGSELYKIPNDSTEPILINDNIFALYTDTIYPDSETCGYILEDDNRYIHVIVQDGYFILEDN